MKKFTFFLILALSFSILIPSRAFAERDEEYIEKLIEEYGYLDIADMEIKRLLSDPNITAKKNCDFIMISPIIDAIVNKRFPLFS